MLSMSWVPGLGWAGSWRVETRVRWIQYNKYGTVLFNTTGRVGSGARTRMLVRRGGDCICACAKPHALADCCSTPPGVVRKMRL